MFNNKNDLILFISSKFQQLYCIVHLFSNIFQQFGSKLDYFEALGEEFVYMTPLTRKQLFPLNESVFCMFTGKNDLVMLISS